MKAPSKFSKTQETTAQKIGVKRASQGGIEPKKKRGKTQSSKDKTTDNNHNEEATRSKANNKGTDTKAPTASSEKKQVDHPKEETAVDSIPPGPMMNEITVRGSDSEMSVLIDEEPKSKSNGRSSGARKPSTKKNTGSKAAKRTEEPVDPDAEEIKRLQGWLTKCGIRKMWYKELAPCKTPKEKIHHLKNMLSDAGMTGRYSAEKAAQIRDERELKADLEAVQEGDRHWGTVNSEEEEPSKPRRRLARGLKELDFLNDDDGEETD